MISRLQTFETEMLAEEENFASLARINRELIGEVEAIDAQQRIVLDMDSTEIPVYGEHYGKPRVMVRDGGDRSPLAGNLRRDGGLCAT